MSCVLFVGPTAWGLDLERWAARVDVRGPACRGAIDALLSGNRTVFVIAHRLSTVRRSDRILVLDKGRLVQQGTHGELMESEGLYRELVTLQAGEFSAPETA